MPFFRQFQSSAPAAPSFKTMALSFMGTFTAIALTGALSYASGVLWLMAPFGASCVLAFGLPDSPLAQPRAIVGGHFLSTLVGLLVMQLAGNGILACAVAVALALLLMQLTRTVHAPAGADPLVVMSAHAGMQFLLFPVLTGSLLIVAIAWCIHNLNQRKSYPRYWI